MSMVRPICSPLIRSSGPLLSKTLTIPASVQAGSVSGGVYPIQLGALPGRRRDGRDVIIKNTSNQVLPHAFIAKNHIAAVDGIYSFYGGPSAIYSSSAGTSGRMFVAYTTGLSGLRYVSEYDIATKKYTRTQVHAAGAPTVDDHNHPGLALNNDGKLVCAATGHNGTVNIKVSTNVGDSTAWGGAVTPTDGTDTSYCWLFNLASVGANGTLCCFTRKDGLPTYKDWWLSTSTDQGATWSAFTQVLSTDTVNNYTQMWSDDDSLIWIAMNETAPNGAEPYNRAIYCVQFDGTNFKDTDGTTIGAAITQTADLGASSVIHAQDSETVRRSVVDIMADGQGYPRILYMRYPGADETDHRVCHARWNGSAWIDSVDVINEGTNWVTSPSESYPGVARFNRADIAELATCVDVAGIREVQLFRTPDNGVSWRKTEDVTKASSKDNFRPVYAHGMTASVMQLDSVPYLFFCGNGVYDSFTSFGHMIKAFPHNPCYAAWVKVDIDGATDVGIRVFWGGADINSETIGTLFDDLGMETVVTALPRFNDDRDGIQGYNSSAPVVLYGRADQDCNFDESGAWARYVVTAASDDRIYHETNYRNATAVSVVFYGQTTTTGQQHFVSNNVAAGPNIIMRTDASNNPQGLVYQTSGYSTVTSAGALSTSTDYLLTFVFDKSDAGQRIKIRTNTTEETSTANDQNVNNSADSAASAFCSSKGEASGTAQLTGSIIVGMAGTAALSKAYTDTLHAALNSPSTFSV